MAAKIIFLLLLLFSLTPWASPPLALALGLALGLSLGSPFGAQSKRLTPYLLQLSVVGLGFGMNLQQVLRAGRNGFVYTILGISFALLAGWLIGKLLRVKPTTSFLIATGTAICGGSAIAAVGPIIQAESDEMSVSLGTVFILNSIALLTFPLVGNHLHLSQDQFGLWSALAIHDTSSVVGAAAKFGSQALIVATTVKLARTLWIVPLCLVTAAVTRSRGRIRWPWFILFFLLAAVVATYLPQAAPAYRFLYVAARAGLTATLFLIGASVSIPMLKQVGPRPLLQGLALWILVIILSLLLIRSGFATL